MSDARQKLYRDRRKEVQDFWGPIWRKQKSNYKFYAGDQFTEGERKRAKERKIPLVGFNFTAQKIHTMTGTEVMQRFQALLRGVEGDDPQVAQAWSAVLDHVLKADDFAQEDSDTFLDCFIAAIGWNAMAMDWIEDPTGQILNRNLYPWEVGCDPAAKRRNLTDRLYDIVFREIPLEAAKRMYPEVGDREWERIANLQFQSIGSASEQKEDAWIFHQGHAVEHRKPGHVILQEYEHKDVSPYFVVQPRRGDDRRDAEPEEFRRLQQEMSAAQLPFEEGRQWYRAERYEYRTGLWVGDEEIFDRPSPIDGFTKLAMTCWPTKTDKGTTFFGLIDLARDPQRWASKLLSLAVEVLAVSPKGGVVRERGAVENERKWKEQIALPGGDPVLRDGAIQNKKIMQLQPPRFPPIAPMLEFAVSSIWQTMGLSPVGTGQVDDVRRAAASSIAQIRQAARAAFAHPFDSLVLYRKQEAVTALKFVGEYKSLPELGEMVGRDLSRFLVPDGFNGYEHPRQPEIDLATGQPVIDMATGQPVMSEERAQVPLDQMDASLTRLAGPGYLKELVGRILKYDVRADERPETTVEPEAMFDILPQMIAVLREAGVPIHPKLAPGVIKKLGVLEPNLMEEWMTMIDDWQKQQQMAAAAGAMPPEGVPQ